MAQDWEDLEDDVNKFDENSAGPEYWMHKRDKYARKSYARCIRCSMKQKLQLDDTGVYAVCPKCDYREVIIEWKV